MSETPSRHPIADNSDEQPSSEQQPDSLPISDDEQPQIDQLLDAWEVSCEKGDPVEVETLCQDHPELVEQVRQRVAALEAVNHKLNSRKKDRLRLEPLQIESKVDDLHFVSAGGLGEVFVGEDSDLHRRVAIKFMHSRLCGDEDSRGRFLLEAEVTGRLEHPGVVPLYGLGCTEDARLFYAMRFIDGETLDDAIKRYYAKADHAGKGSTDAGEIEVEFRRLLTNFVSVCKTIAYAHNRGIVHRDIKPANVMLGRFGETIVVDWGLAVPVSRDERFKSSGEQTLMPSSSSTSGSSSGRGAGTPAFMSPEQASDLAPTPASDIYSLGATLFKILCGQPPVTSKSLQEIRNNLIDGKLPKLSEIRGHIPRPLQAIAYKAMARHAKDRYPTASELAKDVERYLADEPVTAADDSLSVRLARLARRHRAAAQAAVLGLCGCLLIAGVSALALGSFANNAQKLRNQNLTTSSRLIARSFGQEVDRIWRILESLADSSELRTMLMAANQLAADGQQITLENQAEVQAWLEDRLGAERYRILDRLVVLSHDGTQIARAPLPPEPQVGLNFSYRGYFTGLGFDLDPGAKLDKPLSGPKVHPTGVHMSSAYLSTQADEQRLKVTFTVQVLSEDQSQCIGVVGTSMDVGDMMRKLLGKSDIWLADLRTTRIDGKDVRGIVLAHPDMGKQLTLSAVPRLAGTLVETLDTRFDQLDKEPFSDEILAIRDPIRDTEARAAIQPIVIEDRGDSLVSVGWVVIAAEAHEVNP